MQRHQQEVEQHYRTMREREKERNRAADRLRVLSRAGGQRDGHFCCRWGSMAFWNIISRLIGCDVPWGTWEVDGSTQHSPARRTPTVPESKGLWCRPCSKLTYRKRGMLGCEAHSRVWDSTDSHPTDRVCLCVFPFCNIHISHIDVYVCVHHCYWSSAGQTVSSSWTPQRRESAHSSSCLCVSSTWCHCQSQPAGTTPTLNSEPPAFPTPTETERKSKRKRQSKSPESNKSTVKYGMEARDESVFRRRFDWNTWGSVCVCGATLTAGSTATSYFSRMANCSWMGGIWLSILLRSPCRVSRSFRLSPKSGRVWGGWDTLKTHMQPMTLSAW